MGVGGGPALLKAPCSLASHQLRVGTRGVGAGEALKCGPLFLRMPSSSTRKVLGGLPGLALRLTSVRRKSQLHKRSLKENAGLRLSHSGPQISSLRNGSEAAWAPESQIAL